MIVSVSEKVFLCNPLVLPKIVIWETLTNHPYSVIIKVENERTF